MSDDSGIISDLQSKYKLLTTIPQSPLEPADIVYWKKGLRNKRLPKATQPAIVVELPEKTVHDEDKDPGSAYFREPLDVILGFIDEEDGDFILFHFDSRRFTKVKPSE